MNYLHFITDELPTLVLETFIEQIQSKFNIDEHLFVILKQKNKNINISPEKYRNIKVFTFKGNYLIRFFTMNFITIRKLMKQADYIFIHSLTNIISEILFSFKGKAKLIDSLGSK